MGNQRGLFDNLEFAGNFVSETDKRISLSVDSGKVYIYSDPTGADVYLGKLKKGQTPLKISYIDPGEYEITVKKKFYKEIKRKVFIEKKKSKMIFSNLQRARADIDVFTIPPGADVELGTKLKRTSPAKFGDMPSGYYSLKVSKQGFHPLKRKFVLDGRNNFKTTLELQKIKPGFLHVERLPQNASVNIKKIDKPFYQGMELMPGKYFVEITTPFDEGEVLTAEIEENKDTKVYVKLEKGGRVFITSPEKDLKFLLVNEKTEFLSGSFLKKGKYKIALMNKEYEDLTIDIEVKAGKDITRIIEPVKKGRLFVETDAEDLNINIKNVWDKFEQGIYLKAGEYDLEVTSERYPPTQRKVKIESGKDTKIKLNPGEYIEPVTGMKFVYVKGGCYEMGCFDDSKCEKDEKPVHTVCIDGFWIGAHEVTQGQWEKIMKNNPAGHKNGDDYPVEKISWHQAVEFGQKLTDLSKDIFSFRLPTEAEWEYAARSFGMNENFAGGVEIGELGWYEKNSKSTMPVGTKNANYLGIFDMTGNVWEWCLDSYDESAYRYHSKNNPVIMNKNSSKVFRGGSWYTEEKSCSVTNRASFFSGNTDTGIGLRLVRVKGLHMEKVNK